MKTICGTNFSYPAAHSVRVAPVPRLIPIDFAESSINVIPLMLKRGEACSLHVLRPMPKFGLEERIENSPMRPIINVESKNKPYEES